MTIQEMAEVMDVLTLAYPAFYRQYGDAQRKKVLMLWASMFEEDEAALVVGAVKAVIAAKTDDFPPVPGAVKAFVRKLKGPEEMTEGEAWGQISRAARNGLYGSREEFERLPVVLQRLVGSPSQLREWAMMDAETLQTVVASNVQRSYRAARQSQRELDALPKQVRELLGGLSGKLSLSQVGAPEGAGGDHQPEGAHLRGIDAKKPAGGRF